MSAAPGFAPTFGPRPRLQRHWDARAAANFILGGTGAGLLVAAALASQPSPWMIVSGLALIAAGLGAVWLEIGRKLRALNVLFNPKSSWMTREALAVVFVFLLGLGALVAPGTIAGFALALAAAAFLFCQARILQAAKGIPAWRAPQVMPLVVATGLAEGAGIAALFSTQWPLLALLAFSIAARALAWRGYWAALEQRESRAALEGAGVLLVSLGSLVPLALLFAALFLPQVAVLAGLAAAAAGWRLKYVLVTRAAFNQGFALSRLPVR